MNFCISDYQIPLMDGIRLISQVMIEMVEIPAFLGIPNTNHGSIKIVNGDDLRLGF